MMSSLVEALQVSPARTRRRKPAVAHNLYRGVVRSKVMSREMLVCAREGRFVLAVLFFAGFIFLPVDPATHVTNPTVAIVCFTLIQLTRRLILLPALLNRRLSSFDPTTCPSAVIASRTLIALPVWGLAGGKEFYSRHILCK